MGYPKLLPFCFFLILFLVASNFFSNAQSLKENKSGSWLVLSGNNKVHDRWSIPTVGILRHHDIFQQYEFAFVRTGISYKISQASTFTTGVAYLNSKTYMESTAINRASQFWIYEEYALKTKLFSHRWRLETRWKKNIENLQVNNRVRYRIQYSQLLYKKIYLKSFNELFFNLNGPLFDQNRLYMGLGQILTPSVKIDIGYLKNHFKSSAHDVIRMGLTFKTDLTKKEIAQYRSIQSQ
ncbi:MAG: DUF2490 domain-containing protein [Flavobacteriaceae bacterium]